MAKFNEPTKKSKWLVYSEDEGFVQEYNSEDAALGAIQEMIKDQEWSSDIKVVQVIEEYKARLVFDKLA